MIARADISAAYERIRSHVRRTPVIEIEAGMLGVDTSVTLKLEHLQKTGSFKIRGAFNSMLGATLTDAGVVAISGGNHGAAVALAATTLGVKSVVFVPALIAKEVKNARIRAYGAEVIVADGSVDDVMNDYAAYSEKTGALAVHPYGSAETVAGQGTVGLELEDQNPDIDTLFVSVGGGGLIGGIAAWYAGRVKIVAVETTGTASLHHTLNGTLPENFAVSGIAASGLGAPSIGALPLGIIRAHVADTVVVTDADVIDAQQRLWDSARIIAEPGGVTALAALTSGAYVPKHDERVGALVCGGNAVPNWFMA